ncbi:MAG: hypothetical protein KME16_01420 [Scytolyngbya sp. HA4215-MV1]|jgi:methyl-accepting chemotaxis protein|nr:hypothetical protein [Scytolyngbya sp. HA4215-MV1]
MTDSLDARPDHPGEMVKTLAEQIDRLTDSLNDVKLATQQQSDRITQLVALTEQQTQSLTNLLQQPDR